MRTGLALKTALTLAVAALLTGCSQPGAPFPRRRSVGSLKTSLSHLEFENQQLRREVAQLKTDSRDVEDRLVQEETENGTLKAKLDDARHLLSQRGYDFGGEQPSALGRGGDRSDSPNTVPAGQSTRKRRKPPFTRIPGRIEAVPPADPDDDEHVIAPRTRARDDLGAQDVVNDPDHWLPIARGSSAPSAKKGSVR
jgi:hypothetical protein